MGLITITATRNTPAVEYSDKDGVLNISGKSYPEDASAFYTNLTEQILKLDANKNLILTMDFEYLNSSSVTCLLQMLKRIKKQYQSATVSIKLFHDQGDDDMISVGENMNQLSGIPVVFMVKK